MPYAYPAAQVADRLIVTYVGDLLNQRIMSTFWYGISSLIGVPTLGDVMDELRAKLITANNLRDDYLSCCPPQYTLNETWVQFVRPTRYVKKVYVDAQAGTFAGDAHTANIAAVIERRGVTASRKSVSTLHVPCPTANSAITGGSITAGYATPLADLATQVATQVTTATGYVLDPVIDNGVGGTNFTAIGLAFPQTTVRVMRRRTVGLGI